MIDCYARLLILEGVADVPARSWADSTNLMAARARFEGHTLHHTWLASQDSGMIGILLRKVQGWLRRSKKITWVDAEDLLQDVLVTNGTKNKFRAVGVKAMENILSGKETPPKLAIGTLGTWMERYASNFVGREKRRVFLDEVNDSEDHAPIQQVEELPEETLYLYDCLAGNTPAAKILRSTLKQAIHDRFRVGTQLRTLMDVWMAALEDGVVLAAGTEWACRAGLTFEGDTDERNSNTALVATWRAQKTALPIIQHLALGKADMGLAYLDNLTDGYAKAVGI